MDEFIEISSGDAVARIARRGAELKSWKIAGRELIWPGDVMFWAESAPILFPVVGWTRDGIIIEGRRYPLGLHGFARGQDFVVAEEAGDRAVFRLAANPTTRALYPFEFALELIISIQNNKLNIVINVVNEDNNLLPFACGLHPGFNWPLPGATGPHFVRFDREEHPKIPLITPGGLFSPETREIPLHGRELPLTPSLFEEALCFLDARSSGLDFFARDDFGAARPLLRMELENFPHIALWSRPGAAFLCLEAWTGHGDPEGFAGDIFAKPSMRNLGPGESARCAATFIWNG
ncbi:aldose 1-epimerase family protein [uncultured Rhodoblastus sp.]|uniref:aldose epimerase family protein n=1 Tax=uncultured Rhodoblastus sp. TaxID=543037 RepID=UPI0025D435A8|nr:aldose 1-epimerase family protein [uncultured Rhodoblastus sp.]